MYFLNWAMTTIVDSTAIATYCHYWKVFESVPQWLIALIALALVFAMNMVSVALFGEFEFWAAMIKVVALLSFLVAGTIFLATVTRSTGTQPDSACSMTMAGCSRPACSHWSS